VPSEKTTRKRQSDGPRTFGSFYLGPNYDSQPTLLYSGSNFFDGGQITVSEGHSWPPKGKGFSGDVGGDFVTNKSECFVSGTPVKLIGGTDPSRFYSYYGHLLPVSPNDVLGGHLCQLDIGLSDDELNAKGAEAIARCSPTNPLSDVATFLAELHSEGLPGLPFVNGWKSRTKGILHVPANEVLNTEFGLLPMVEEIQSFADSVKHAGSVLEQYRRDAGKGVRRQFRFPLDLDHHSEIVKESRPPILSDGNYGRPELYYGSPGNVVLIRDISRRLWFSGEFTYHLPEGDNLAAMFRHALEAEKLFGIEITPEVLWNLAPWSWAVDWFSDAGEVITNLQNFKIYGLVMRYGYIMEETILSDFYTYEGPTSLYNLHRSGGEFVRELIPPSSVCSVSVRSVQKKRVQANPFGFGIEWADLSPTQLAIAAALGITHLL